MRHFMDEQALQPWTMNREIIPVAFGARVEMHVSAGRHDRADRLKREPAPAPNTHRRRIDSLTEYGSDENHFSRREFSLAARLTSVRDAPRLQ
tara:strand:- start:719 stop:997 length:279 start_codon:yes stop_codon:yes gene_type:complete